MKIINDDVELEPKERISILKNGGSICFPQHFIQEQYIMNDDDELTYLDGSLISKDVLELFEDSDCSCKECSLPEFTKSVVFNGKNAEELKSFLAENGLELKQEPNGKKSVEINGKEVGLFKDDEFRTNGVGITINKPSYVAGEISLIRDEDKEKIVRKLLEVEPLKEVLSGDIWINSDSNIKGCEEQGVFVQVELVELEDGEYSEDVYCFYGYKNLLSDDGAHVESDYNKTLFKFELNKEEITLIDYNLIQKIESAEQDLDTYLDTESQNASKKPTL